MERFLAINPVPQASLEHFSSIPWTAVYLKNELYEPVPTFSRILKPSGEDAFFSTTISTPTTIPYCLTLSLRNLPPIALTGSSLDRITADIPYSAPAPSNPDCLWLLSLATPGLNGHPNVIHGGLAAAILDEILGLCVMMYQTHRSEPRVSLYTARLETQYRAPVVLPSEVLCKAWLIRREGRKWWARGQIVDMNGLVLTEASGLWVEAKRADKL